jgi:hypothetical protein
MFAKPPGSGSILEIKNDARRTQILDAVRGMIARHSAIDYDRLLEMAVDRSVSTLHQSPNAKTQRDHTKDGLQPLSHSQVCRFVTAILKGLLDTAVRPHSLGSICQRELATGVTPLA